MGIGQFIAGFLGGDNEPDTAEARIFESTASAPDQVVKAGPATPGPVSLLTHPFLRGMDENGMSRGLVRPFERSAWVQRAIKHVSDPIAGVPLRFATMTKDGLKAFINPTLANWWNWPAIGPEGLMSRAAVVSASVGWLKLAGEFFWVLSDNWLVPRGPRDPFIIVRPDQIKQSVSSDGSTLLGWWFRDAAGHDHALLPEQVIHQKLWNPYDPIRGCPEYASAKVAAEGDAFAGEFARNMMKGNGDRGPIISSESPVNEVQMAQIEAALRAKKRAAEQGIIKTTFLPANVKVQDPQVTRADSEFIAQRIENRKEIYMAFGVPSSFAEQMHRATTAHESDRYILIEDTCLPTGALVAAPIALLAMRMLGIAANDANALVAYFDFEQHSVMLQARAERIDAAMKLWGMGMPFRQVNTFLNLQAPTFPGDDVSYLPLAIQTAEEAATPQPKPTDPKPPKEPGDTEPDDADDPPEGGNDATQQMIRLLSAPRPTILERALSVPVAKATPEPALALPDSLDPVPGKRSTEDDAKEAERSQMWNRQMKLRRPAEKLMQKAVGRVIYAARVETLRKIEVKGANKADGATVQKDDDDKGDATPHPGNALSVIFDPQAFSDSMVAAVDRIGRQTIQNAGDELRDEVGVDDPWTAPASTVLNALRDREPLIRNASADIYQDILSTLEEGFKNGDTTQQLADRVREAFNGISDGRAQNIAVTETGAAYSAGREASAKDAGFKSKEWLSARDKKVRPDHREADGQAVKSDALFSVGGEQTPFPCGPGLSAAQACNCRCVVLYRPGAPGE